MKPFTLTIKCPQCDRVTSFCTDTSLTKDRVEFQGVRCSRCVRATAPNGLKRPVPRKAKLLDPIFLGTGGRGMYPGRHKKARMTGRFTGIR